MCDYLRLIALQSIKAASGLKCKARDVRLVRLLLEVGEGAEDPNVCMLCMFNKQFLALHHSQIGPCCPCCLVSHLGLESHMLVFAKHFLGVAYYESHSSNIWTWLANSQVNSQ